MLDRGAIAGFRDAHLVSGYTREQVERRQAEPSVRLAQFLEFADFERVALSGPRTIPERAAKLLQAIKRRTHYFGETIALKPETDYTLAYARNSNEFMSFGRYIRDRAWAVLDIDSFAPNFTLTAAGFAEIEGRAQARAESDQAFIARYFDATLDDAYEHGIKPAIEDSGFLPIPVNAREYNGDIVDQIMVEIRKSRFVVADTTGHRGGVYFEAGFALGLGIEVIFSCKKDHFDKSHFDVNHMNHIIWQTADDLRKQLSRRVQRTIGFGPKRAKTG
jgi:nucleoside 2-deoxyribosyltransferase